MDQVALRAYIELGSDLQAFLKGEKRNENLDALLRDKMPEVHARNNWFTADNVIQAIRGIAHMLDEARMKAWLEKYKTDNARETSVGLIMAGNVPLVGFHDLMSVLLTGHKAQAKLATEDGVLLPIMLKGLSSHWPELEQRVEFTDRFSGHDAVIATGSNNSARYFEYYFRDVPHIIRKNRNSVAVLTGDESEEDLVELGKDIFTFFGLGCRNVSKLFIPEGFDLDRIFGAIVNYGDVIQNKKYANNYDYYKAIHLMNKEQLLENGFVLFKEDPGIYSPVAMLFYERYQDMDSVIQRLDADAENIQCTVSSSDRIPGAIPFGRSQYPEPWDYADGVDTVEFLGELCNRGIG